MDVRNDAVSVKLVAGRMRLLRLWSEAHADLRPYTLGLLGNGSLMHCSLVIRLLTTTDYEEHKQAKQM